MKTEYKASFRQTWNSMEWRFRLGAVIVLIILFFGFVVYQFSPGDVMALNTYGKNLPISREHWLGTTVQGQDIFWFLIEALHNSLIIGFLVAAFSSVIGIVVGLLSGFVGGKVDRILLFVCDVIVVIPSLLILIMLSSLLKGRANILTISGILVMFDWPRPARQARSMALSMRQREFINTARFSGESLLKIVFVEILPHVMSWSLTTFINLMMSAISAESALAIFGVSSITTPTLGNMIYLARRNQALMLKRWVWIGSPIVLMMLLFIGLFFTYDGYSKYMAKKRGNQG